MLYGELEDYITCLFALVTDELHDCSSIKSFKAINISDCKTTVDIAEKIINRNAIIEIAVF